MLERACRRIKQLWKSYLGMSIWIMGSLLVADSTYIIISSPKASLVFALCNALPQEVLDLGLNKYGSAEEKAKFQDWLT